MITAGNNNYFRIYTFYQLGDFVYRAGEQIDFENLKSGDLIFAERIKNKLEETIDNSRENFNTDLDWIIQLHMAVFHKTDQIWHASHIAGKASCWPLAKFLEYYRPVVVKRII